MVLGLVCLAAANISHLLLSRVAGISTDTSDLIFGLFMGLAIGLLIWSMRARRDCSLG